MKNYTLGALILMSVTSLQAKTLIGIYGDWGTFKSRGTCYSVSAPRSVVAGRAAAQLVVTRWNGVDTQVMISAGAALRTVSLRVGGQKFDLAPRGGDAWMPDSRGDALVLNALIASNVASVEGRTVRGNRVSDTYTLTGFGESWAAAQKACSL